jgi:hypothetical protein
LGRLRVASSGRSEKLADRALFILQQAARVIDIVVAATGRLLYLTAHG